MADLKLIVNVDQITKQFDEFKDELKFALEDGVRSLASMTHAKVLSEASENLRSLSQQYTDAVSFEEVEKNLWVVSLDLKKAGWIEEGRKSGFQEELLYGKSSKVSKSGERYAVIPFKHNKNPSQQGENAQNLAQEIKMEMKARKIPYKEIETNPDGSPRLGMIHRFNVDSPRLKEHHKDKPLKGVAIYQRKDKSGAVQKDIMTFRVISEKHRQEGKWNHPGRDGEFIFESAFLWAENEWNTNVMPEIMGLFGKS